MSEPYRPIVTLAAGAIVFGALYFASPLFIPLASAVLLAFVLGPLLTRLQKLGLPKTLAVVVVFGALLSFVGLLGWLVAGELVRIMDDVPDMRANLVEKLRALRGPLRSLADALGWIERLSREVQVGTPSGTPQVEVVESPGPLEWVASFVTPLLAPAAYVAATFLITVFLLLERDALRARLSRFLGSQDQPMTSRALDEASERVSLYLGRQVLLCVIHGSLVAAGAWWIGVPGPLVCGAVAGAGRLLPYLGPWLGAALPTAIAAVAIPGWGGVVQMVGFLVVLEVVSNNVLEPWLYGRGTGLSPFGVVLAAFFWGFLWGPVGLVLAVPITVCFVVLGRYVPRLSFLTAFLGDEAIAPEEPQLYQSLIFQERDQAAALLRRLREDRDLVTLSDGVVMPTWVRIARDRERGSSPGDRPAQLALELESLLDELPDAEPEASDAEPLLALLATARRDPVEECGLRWLARVLASRGVRVRRVALEALLRDRKEPSALRIVSALAPGSAGAGIARLRRSDASPSANLLLASFGGAADGLLRMSSQIEVAQSCAEIVERIERLRGASTNADTAADPTAGETEAARAPT